MEHIEFTEVEAVILNTSLEMFIEAMEISSKTLKVIIEEQEHGAPKLMQLREEYDNSVTLLGQSRELLGKIEKLMPGDTEVPTPNW